MKRDDYIEDTDVSDFIDFLIKDINGNGPALKHKLSIRDNRVPKGYQQNRNIDSLRDGFESYFWDSKDFADTSRLLVPLRASLCDALGFRNNAILVSAAGDVFDWGLTPIPAKWNKKWARDSENFLASISSALREISSDNPNPEIFDDKRCRMNAGYTKVYALLDDRSIIYDGRVGAALGFLVSRFLIQKKRTELPPTLSFPWAPGAGRSYRNPSSENFRFPTLQSVRGVGHATWNIRANWIINEVVSSCQESTPWLTDDPVRKLEAALFMIGYELPMGGTATPAAKAKGTRTVTDEYVDSSVSVINALNGSFNVNELIEHMRTSGLDYLIQGQQECSYANHTKKQSLDYWIRGRSQRNRDQKQADNRVLDQLVSTGFFRIEAKLECPETSRKCKGIVFIPE